jgi:signal transduction histidine kinase/CheY-like chemotaxis protein/HPt (histidine-containing phosphotransfer) domain-containing protein
MTSNAPLPPDTNDCDMAVQLQAIKQKFFSNTYKQLIIATGLGILLAILNVASFNNKPLAWAICIVTIGALALIALFAMLGYQREVRQILMTRIQQLGQQQAMQQGDFPNHNKGHFLTNMSHEIRTPMHAVLGVAHLLSNTGLNSEQQKYLTMIQDSGNSLMSSLNDILDFSTIEAGQLTLAPISFRLADLIEAVMNIGRTYAGHKSLTLEHELAADVPTALYADALRLQQILVNLLRNAVKFTRQGKIELIITAVQQQAHQVTLQIIVRDTGIGMSEELLGRLFQPFTQADTSNTRQFEGSGLGLTICERLITLMNGQISVRSQLNQGSEFCITLPLEKASDESLISDFALSGQYQIGDPRVLVVEDNLINQIVARGLLTQAGAHVEVVGDGLQCVKHLRDYPDSYDLVLMDIQMPVMDGFEATKAIRSELNLQLPILAMTAGVMEWEQEKCLASGMNGFIGKPIHLNQMFATLAQFLPAITRTAAAPPSTPISTVVLNLDEIFNMAQGSPEHETVLLGVIKKMTVSSPIQIQQVYQDWLHGRDAEAARLLHTMRGSIGSLGAQRFADTAKELELAIRANPALPRELVKSMFESTQQELNQIVTETKIWLGKKGIE